MDEDKDYEERLRRFQEECGVSPEASPHVEGGAFRREFDMLRSAAAGMTWAELLDRLYREWNYPDAAFRLSDMPAGCEAITTELDDMLRRLACRRVVAARNDGRVLGELFPVRMTSGGDETYGKYGFKRNDVAPQDMLTDMRRGLRASDADKVMASADRLSGLVSDLQQQLDELKAAVDMKDAVAHRCTDASMFATPHKVCDRIARSIRDDYLKPTAPDQGLSTAIYSPGSDMDSRLSRIEERIHALCDKCDSLEEQLARLSRPSQSTSGK